MRAAEVERYYSNGSALRGIRRAVSGPLPYQVFDQMYNTRREPEMPALQELYDRTRTTLIALCASTVAPPRLRITLNTLPARPNNRAHTAAYLVVEAGSEPVEFREASATVRIAELAYDDNAHDHCDGGHENLPVGGHRNSPLMATGSPHGWPSDLPATTVLS
jgi:hypothetical protein